MSRNNGCFAIMGKLTTAIFFIPISIYAAVYLLARRSGRLPGWLQRVVDGWYFPTYVDPAFPHNVPTLVAAQGQAARILLIGGSRQHYPLNVVNIDIAPGSGITAAADAHRLPFASGSFDCVIAAAVFEHLAQPWVATAEVERVLKSDGLLYIEVPFLQPYHADPDDYFRYTIPGLRSLFRNFEEQDSGVFNGPGSMLTWILTETAGVAADVDGNFETTRQHLAPAQYMRAKEAGRLLFGPLKYLDRWLLRKEHSFVVASGVYYLGRKR